MNIPPLSYTNKDFASIYEELLHLAKKISYKFERNHHDSTKKLQ